MLNLTIQPYTDTNNRVLCLTNEYDSKTGESKVINHDDVSRDKLSDYINTWMAQMDVYRVEHSEDYSDTSFKSVVESLVE